MCARKVCEGVRMGKVVRAGWVSERIVRSQASGRCESAGDIRLKLKGRLAVHRDAYTSRSPEPLASTMRLGSPPERVERLLDNRGRLVYERSST
jgi:hypothetical protein